MPGLGGCWGRAGVGLGALAICACGGASAPSATPTPAPLALVARMPIDGVPDFSVFDQVFERTLDFVDVGNGRVVRRTTLRYGITNDDRDVYVALEWGDPARNAVFVPGGGPINFDGVRLLIDGDGDGRLGAGDDAKALVAAGAGSYYTDLHFPATGGGAADAIGDGFGKLTWDAAAGLYRTEFLFPLRPDARGEDASVSAATRYDIQLFDNVNVVAGGGAVAALDPALDGSPSWPRLPYVAAVTAQRPELPADLTGQIALISDIEEPNGEIYVFDPATRGLRRVTRLPGLYKDNVSLSHDRTRLAFQGSPDRNDPFSFEIYVVNIDGSGLRALTRNRLLDGHPGWSPDDTGIAYASLRRSGQLSIVMMTSNGQELGELTPPGVSDNDPDFLPDGRIVFKTDRFSIAPQVRLAAMLPDGSGAIPLTFKEGVSDHDPTGTNDLVVSDRFPRPTDHADDPEATFVGWDIVEARADGSGERTLLSDGWVNWLPVFDPSHRYVAHLKTVGAYTDVHLMTADGQEIGRLVPNLTQARYLDWK